MSLIGRLGSGTDRGEEVGGSKLSSEGSKRVIGNDTSFVEVQSRRHLLWIVTKTSIRRQSLPEPLLSVE